MDFHLWLICLSSNSEELLGRSLIKKDEKKKKEKKEGEKKKKGEVWRDDGALKPAL